MGDSDSTIDFGTSLAPIAQPMPKLTPFLTFVDINAYIEDGFHVGMWQCGCLLDDGTYNCTKVCADPQLLYRQPYKEVRYEDYIEYDNATETVADLYVPYNIYNCMMYPYISSLLTNSSASDQARSNAQQLADVMHILPGINDAKSSVFKDIRDTQWNCVEMFCNSSLCGKGLRPEDFENGTTVAQKGLGLSQIPEYNFPDWSRISQRSSMDVYTDVAGIGVSIAFIIQAAIILMCWLFACIYRIRRYLSKPENRESIHTTINGITQKGFVPKKIGRALEKFVNAHYSDALDTPVTPYGQDPCPPCPRCAKRTDDCTEPKSVSDWILEAMTSFQSAQCFFLLSMNIAILIGLAAPGPFMMSSSFGQFSNNLLYTQAIAQGAAAFVCLTQYCLYVVGKRSIYFLILTLLTFAISATTFALANANGRRYNSSRLDIRTAHKQRDTWQLGCGMVSPQTYNGSLGRNIVFGLNVNPYMLGISILTFASAIILGLGGGMYWRFRIVHERRLRELKTNKEHNKKAVHTDPIQTSKRWYKRVALIFGLLFEICMWGWIIVFIIFFWYPIYSVIPGTWSLGQVLAVSIWVPGLIEWFHAGIKIIEPKILVAWDPIWRQDFKTSQIKTGQTKMSQTHSISKRSTASKRHSHTPSEVPLLDRSNLRTQVAEDDVQ